MQNIVLDLSNPVQSNFLGNNAVYHGFAGMPDDAGRVYSDELCELEADRVAQMGVKIVRTYFKWFAWSRCSGWNYENETMRAFYKWCSRMQKRGIEIAIHGGWCSPGDVNGTSWGGEGPFADGAAGYDEACENFAAYVSEMLHQLIEVRGFTNIKYLMLFTESERSSGDCGNMTSFEAWEKASRAIDKRLKKDGRRGLVKLVGPNENARTWCGPHALQYAKDHASDFLDAYGCHIYARTCIEDKNGIHTGKRSVPMIKPGHRIQQRVSIKKGLNYKLSVWVRTSCEDPKYLSGYIIFGFFEKPSDKLPVAQRFFTSGGQKTSRLDFGSTALIDPSAGRGEWKRYEVSYTPDRDSECVVGIFSDVKTKDAVVYIDDFSLTAEGGNNLLKNPSFEEETDDWNGVYCTPVSYDIYNDWYIWAKTMLNVVKGNHLWYDEYNCLHEFNSRFTDPLHGSRLAMGVVALMNAGVQNSFLWTLFDQQWPNNHTNNNDSFVDGNHRCGLMPVLTDSLVPYPDYYAFALLSKYAGSEGTQVFSEKTAPERLHATLTKQPDGNYTLIVVSGQGEGCDLKVELPGLDGICLKRHLYDPAAIKPDEMAETIGWDNEYTVSDGILNDTLPAYAVAVYTTADR